MSDKVKHYLLVDGIGIAIHTLITLVLLHLCSYISYDILKIATKIIVITLSTCVYIFVTFFFLLYWWSDIKWTKCKQKARKLKKVFW